MYCNQQNSQVNMNWNLIPEGNNFEIGEWVNQVADKHLPQNSNTNYNFQIPTASYDFSKICIIPKTQLYDKVHALQKHRAHITFLHTPNGGMKTIIKRKRQRTMFRTEQVEILEEVFKRKPYVTREDRQNLVQRLNIPDRAIKVWFQNRRLKGKRELQEEYGDYLENSLQHSSSKLDYIEAEINKGVDEFGFVTLTNEIMDELVKIIDSALSCPVQTECSPIYEPISPASDGESHQL